MIAYCSSCGCWQECSEVLPRQATAGKGMRVRCRTCGGSIECAYPVRAFALDVPNWLWLAAAFTVGAAAGTWLTFWAIG